MIRKEKIRDLEQGYAAQIDNVDEETWTQILQEFDDSNIYQTWPYGSVISGLRNTSHLILTRNGQIVAAAQTRLARLPLISAGVAYVRWGPLWRRTGGNADEEIFRQSLRALRNEYVCRRGLVVRLLPALFEESGGDFRKILEEEGFSYLATGTRSRTIIMDLQRPIEELREGMKAHWKRELKVAERGGLEVVAGSSDELFAEFIGMYKEMVARKKFTEPNDIHQFRAIQARLPEKLKMKIMLCRLGNELAAGVVSSAIGDTAVYLFGATSNAGMKGRGSYLLQWKFIEKLKESGVAAYDLNGVNPETNPGTYKFKSDLAGSNSRDVHFLGRFDAYPGSLARTLLEFADSFRAAYKNSRERMQSIRAVNLNRLRSGGVPNGN